MPKAPIILLTDFGAGSPYPNIMKGAIAAIAPETRIIDLFHGVEPQNVKQAAFLLHKTFSYFPAGSIFTAVVDPGVGSNRRNLACQIAGYVFVSPDNGTLSYIVAEQGIERAVEISNRKYMLPEISSTFHGRDIFAPAAAHISNGAELAEFGAEIELNSIVTLEPPLSIRCEDGSLTGEVMMFDDFGNIITSINDSSVLDFNVDTLKIKMKNLELTGVSKTYSSVDEKGLVAYIGSFGTLEIGINKGSAQKKYGVQTGDLIFVSR